MITQIAKEVAQELNNRGYDAEAITVNKNGVEMAGISIGNQIIYHPDWKGDIEDIISYVLRSYEEFKLSDDVLNEMVKDFYDYEKMKENIIPYVCAGIVPDAATRPYLNVNVYYKYINGNYGIVIKKEHLEKWDVTESEIYRQAKKNVKGKYIVKDILDILPPYLLGDNPMPRGMMRIVTLPEKTYGSGALLFPKVFEEINNGEDLTIIPSSIHELIVIRPSMAGVYELVEMITSVNQTECRPEEVLGNKPYVYSDGEVKEAK